MSVHQAPKWHTSLANYISTYPAQPLTFLTIAGSPVTPQNLMDYKTAMDNVQRESVEYISCGHNMVVQALCPEMMGQIHLWTQWRHSASQWQGGERANATGIVTEYMECMELVIGVLIALTNIMDGCH